MEMPLVNETSFTQANPASYSLEDFWPLGSGIGDHGRNLGLRMFGNRDGTAEESTVTEQSISRKCRGSVGGRKRRVAVTEDESSKIVRNCDAEELKNLNSKRVKSSESNGGSKSLKEEVDGISAAVGKCAEHDVTVSEPPKQDFIHVRARRGQATDSHSLAERARREKISERMKILQDLVPSCNKVIGKALVLDEIINYVQALQHQVEFLSMKLEAINSSMIPKDKTFSTKDLEVPRLDAAGMMFGTQTQLANEYGQGPHTEWLHMQLGRNFEGAT